jgi:hypothetical protein
MLFQNFKQRLIAFVIFVAAIGWAIIMFADRPLIIAAIAIIVLLLGVGLWIPYRKKTDRRGPDSPGINPRDQ